MLFLVDTSEPLEKVATEIGGEVGQLLTPLTRFRNQGGKFAIDNGAFSSFKRSDFLSLLEREKPNKKDCIFVCAPDVVGDARRTLEVSQEWHPKLFGWPLALVCQDGQENLPIPWGLIQAVFIGGTTKWKCSPMAVAICKAAKILDKWVHVGRVNTPDRLGAFEGFADSVDGTGISRYSHMRTKIRDDNRMLFLDQSPAQAGSGGG